MRLSLSLVMLLGTVWGASPAKSHYPDPSQPLLQGWLTVSTMSAVAIQTEDSVGGIDVNSPNFKYPGKAMLYSLIVPGAGQLYVRQPLKTVVFLGAEIIAILLLKDYNQRGLDQTQAFKDSADVHWDFRHWIDRASSFTGPGWEDLPNIGTKGTHSLDYFVVMTEGERPMLFGKTSDDRFLQLYDNPDTTDHVFVKMNDEYYENIGKYNQFLSGWDDAWDDANPALPDVVETPSGPIARTPQREAHLSMREEANRLKSTASYVASAIMFNHVLSAVDAIFATAKWNRRHALRVGGRLWFDPTYTLGVRGVQFSLAW